MNESSTLKDWRVVGYKERLLRLKLDFDNPSNVS